MLFDEIVLKAERFLLVLDEDVDDVARFMDEGAGFGFEQSVVVKVTANAGAQVFCLADVDDGLSGVGPEVNARAGGELTGLFLEDVDPIHGGTTL